LLVDDEGFSRQVEKKFPPSTRVNTDSSMGAERQVYPRTENQTMNKNVEMKHASFVWVEFLIGDPKQDKSRELLLRPATNTDILFVNKRKNTRILGKMYLLMYG
jgi:hypothetical protein